IFCSGSQRSISDLANCGLRREPGAVRTSTSSTTPAWWSSAAKSVAGVVPWPTVTIRAKAFTFPLHHGLGARAGQSAGVDQSVMGPLPQELTDIPDFIGSDPRAGVADRKGRAR